MAELSEYTVELGDGTETTMLLDEDGAKRYGDKAKPAKAAPAEKPAAEPGDKPAAEAVKSPATKSVKPSDK
jgi:hypothetical protein